MKRIILTFLLAAACFCAHAQSSQKVTDMISTKQATWGDASYFLAVQSGLTSDEVSDQQAFDALKENGYISEKVSEKHTIEEPILIKDFALLFTKTTHIKGGIMYRITKAPRYALRELKAKGFITNETAPNSKLRGRQLLEILSAYEEATNE